MSLAIAQPLPPVTDLPVSPGQVAGELIASVKAAEAALGHGKIGLIEQLLSYAANAEQQLAEQKQRIAQLEALTETDDLTGALNRRGFHNALTRTLDNAARHHEQGLVIYIDLDGFKAVNDTYGHDAGDAVLKTVAHRLQDMVRSTDYVARLGGDEFAVILVRADLRAGRQRAEEIERLLNPLGLTFGGQDLSVGASVGVAPYGPESDADLLIRSADKAMYRAKTRRKALA